MVKKIYGEVYGCSANQSDYEMAMGILKNHGYKIVDNFDSSDLNIIFTCIVKTPTSQRMVHRIKELTKLKKSLIVAGCMPKTEKMVIEKISPKASLLGPNSIHVINDVVNSTINGKKIVFLKDLKKPKLCLPRIRKNSLIDICEISNGCLGNCAFCEVKFAKGKLISYPSDLIIKEIKKSLKEGCKEIWLTSQDCGCWGLDNKSSLPKLLEKINKIEGKFFVRIGMMNPTHIKNILNDLLQSYESKKIFKFIHIPVQSGSDSILKKMNRNYSVKEFKSIVKEFGKKFPRITLSTDIIVGYPGETKKDFEKTIDLIKNIKPDIVNLSKFGARPKTKAAEMEQLPVKIINERSRKISKIMKEIQVEKNKEWIGWEGKVLVDETKNGNIIGRNFAYKPIVLKMGKLGKSRRVRIISASHICLFE